LALGVLLKVGAWIDAQSQALLDLIADGLARARVLLLVNYRPEYRHEWTNKSYYSQLRLDPLGDADGAAMLTALLGESVELNPLKRLITECTGGNPFFIEEIVQALFDEGALVRNGAVKMTRSLSQLRLPPTVQGILASRIDRQPDEHKQLLQMLAVIGRQSSLELLKQVASHADTKLQRMLADLQAGEFIYEQPTATGVECGFKHALTQEVAYNSLLIERRKSLHGRAATAMEALYTSRLDDHLSELGRHYQRSGNSAKAIEYLQRAGAQAVPRSAHAEGIGLLTSTLELLKGVPETPGRMQQELGLQLGLGSALSAIKGFSAPETGQAFGRASELCRQLGDTPHLFAVLVGLAIFYRLGAEFHKARELAQQLLSIAERECDAVSLVEANLILGVVRLALGDFAESKSHLERAIAVPKPAHPPSYHTPYDPQVVSLCWAGLAQLILGYPDQALANSREAVALARTLSHPFTLVGALELSSCFHQFRGEDEEGLALCDELLRLATEHGFQLYVALALAGQGARLIQINRAEEGIALLREGLSAVRAAGMYQSQTIYLAELGEGCGKVGRTVEGLAAVAEGLAVADRTGERMLEAELYRVKGDLLMHTAPAAANVAVEAESCFRHAIEIARDQQAKWWELRATVRLARLLAKQGHRDKARMMLAEIYCWFTEGFDTADLKDAKAPLDELGQES
jgi:tetratricopeptide (TPR) repeat protein